MFLSFCCRDHPLPLPRSPWQSINADKTEHHRLHSSYSWISLGRAGCITIPRTSSRARVQWETFSWKVCARVCLCTASTIPTTPPPPPRRQIVLVYCLVRSEGIMRRAAATELSRCSTFGSAIIYASMSCKPLCSRCCKWARRACSGMNMYERKTRKTSQLLLFFPPLLPFDVRGKFTRSSLSKISHPATPLLQPKAKPPCSSADPHKVWGAKRSRGRLWITTRCGVDRRILLVLL